MNKEILNALEEYLNNQIVESFSAREIISNIGNKAILIEIMAINFRIFIIFKNSKIYLLEAYDEEVEVSVSGYPLSLLNFLYSNGKDLNRITIEGDAAILEDAYRLFNLLIPDIEYYLSEIFGDLAINDSKNLFKKLFQYKKNIHDKLIINMKEYFQEESRTLPSKNEVNSFFNEVDVIRDDVERLILSFEKVYKEG
ncbi:MAG: hypothetical protein CBC38_02560 [Gammaproteobacteria bacterium TMED78]|nr:MAG: hypothetical protein CBC38_02560 [Gammaproteobacteria bacterium TMED78]|tara:strand:+ start:1499 stop:2089 length:591 start_codon:yes stop_codon:yes gene_type:complete